jgi:hypothetical protein
MHCLCALLFLALPTLAVAQQHEINWKQIQQPLMGDATLGYATGTITAPTGSFSHLLNLPSVTDFEDQTGNARAGSAVYSATENKIYVFDGTAWAEVSSATSEAEGNEAVADLILAVTDLAIAGAGYYRYLLPNYQEPGSPFYSKAFKGGTPIVRVGRDAELTPYVLFLPGATVGSHRGFRVNLQSGTTFSTAWELKILGVLEIVDGVPWSDLCSNRAGGVQMYSDPLSTRMSGRFLRR